MYGNFFIPSNTEGSDSVSGLGENWLLTSKLLQHLSCTSELITRLANANIQTKFGNAHFAHSVTPLLSPDPFLLGLRLLSHHLHFGSYNHFPLILINTPARTTIPC